MARPRIQAIEYRSTKLVRTINLKQLDDLAHIGCTIEEIASILGCRKTTLETRYQARIKNGHDNMRMSLRRKQLAIALGRSKSAATMCIWLGKQLLGQKDSLEHTGANGGPIVFSLESIGQPKPHITAEIVPSKAETRKQLTE